MAIAPFMENTISSGGGNRTYDYYSPPGLANPAPLCVVLHGGAQTIERILDRLQMAGSPAAGLVVPPYHVVAPQGEGVVPLTGWNSGHSPGGQLLGTDDVTFIADVVDDYTVQVSGTASPVDPKRIYVIGFSNGGMMAYRLAAEKSELFAAVCVISGNIGGRPTLIGTPHVNDPLILNPPHPVSVYHVHGLLDDVVSPFGGPSPNTASTRVDRGAFNSINTWVRHNNC
ncbi:MAG: hypothetical protein HKN85_08935, partial [Gammaproteobacteria bacterium]|nr:hypothetical protein [Gammaproteobacteria bacterium]